MNISYDFEDSNQTLGNGSQYYDYNNYILDDDGNLICEELTDEDREFYANFAGVMENMRKLA